MADDGTVTPFPVAVPSGAEPALAVALRAPADDLADQLQWQLKGALAAAAEADQDAARALREVTEPVTGGWGVGLAVAGLLTGAPLRLLADRGVLTGISLRALPPAGASPTEVAHWWVGLSPDQQRLQVRANPEAIGALDGIPARDRHAANLLVLTSQRKAIALRQADLKARYRATGDPAALREAAMLEPRRRMLDAVAAQLAGHPERTLLLLDPQVPGRAAIAIGPVDSAEHVAVVVPGLEQDVTEDLGRVVGNADRLAQRAGRMGTRGGEGQVATVAWLGYHTPGFDTVAFTGHAERGAVQLHSTLLGLRAAREAGGPGQAPLHLTLVGHSYGSLTSGLDARTPTGVDDLVLVGSPGVGTDHASGLQVPAGHVFVGEAHDDPVADLAHFGTDPSSPEFGAVRFQTDGGTDPATGATLTASVGHSQYFESGSESLRNLALIILGRSEPLTTGDSTGVGDLLVTGRYPIGPR